MAEDMNCPIAIGPQVKNCSTCRSSKPLDQFSPRANRPSGRRSACKACVALEVQAYRARNPDKVRAYDAHYKAANSSELREKAKQRARILRKDMPERVRETKRRWDATEKGKQSKRSWRLRNMERARAHAAKQISTPKGRLQNAVRSYVYNCLTKGSKRGRRTFSLLGYSVEELKQHIERQFLPRMNWENYGDWHIDHIVPLSMFNYETPDDPDFRRAWALSNLRPLWAEDNIRKGGIRLTLF